MKVDEKDRLLLALLARDARMKNCALAERVGLSPSACLVRVNRLEASGIILGYRAIIALNGTGSKLEALAEVKLLDASADSSERFAELVRSTDSIIEAHQVAGHYDYVLRFHASDPGTWKDFRQKLDGLGCATQFRFSVLLGALK